MVKTQKEHPRTGEPDHIRHNGPLTLSSLDRSLPRYLFVPASSEVDPFHIGWEHVRFTSTYRFEVNDLPFATADGVATLAAVVECLRTRPNSQVEVHISDTASKWGDALGLGQIATGNWADSIPRVPSNPSGCHAFPVFRFAPTSRDACSQMALELSQQVKSLWDILKREDAEEICAAVRSVTHEALLNVLEHAYQPNQLPVVFSAITVSPAPIAFSKSGASAGDVEKEWFQNLIKQGMMLEIAIADYGVGVPSTLWKAYRKEHSEAFAQITGLTLGSQRGQIERAKLHHSIALWSFHHKSTRKNQADFPNPLAFLNWRGLHRAMNTVASLSGCLVMRTGAAKTGFAFHLGASQVITFAERAHRHEFPGTGIILRFPIWKSIAKPAPTWVEPIQSSRQIIFSRTIAITDSPTDTAEAPLIHPVFRAVAHPFSTLTADDLPQFLERYRSISPKNVEVHMFVREEPGLLLNQLQAFDEAARLGDVGPPSLMAVADQGGRLAWRFVGLMPESARSLISGLEASGEVRIGPEEADREFANSLVRVFKPLLRIEGGGLRLACFDSKLSANDLQKALQKAFDVWSARTTDPWLFAQPGKVVRLTTGRLVRKYVSVLKLLNCNTLLEEALGLVLGALFESLELQFPDFVLITDSDASAYIVGRLLKYSRRKVTPIVGLPKGAEALGNLVVFVDAVEKGETLRALVDRMPNCRLVIICVDLRRKTFPNVGSNQAPLLSLLNFPFDPEDVNEESLSGEKVLEVDSVTHIPVGEPPTESFPMGTAFGTSAEREAFLLSNRDLFRYGLHRSGGRTHIVTLATAHLLEDHWEKVLKWLCERIEHALLEAVGNRQEKPDVVIFTRNEAHVKDLVPKLGAQLVRSNVTAVRDVFRVILPTVPSGPTELHGRPTTELLEDLRSFGSEQVSFVKQTSRFLAVYLDDACVTGKTLIDFLIRVSLAKSDQLPAAVLAVPVLSRFSPAEERFFTLVLRHIGADAIRSMGIPFWFAPLFRLQIRSYGRLESTPVFALVSELVANGSHLNKRIRDYVATINRGLSSLRTALSTRDRPILPHAHVFYAGSADKNLGVSAEIVRIRHLIALQEQNVGVLSRLLQETKRACEANDYSLLTALALEPRLLETPPLEKECWNLVTDLAIRCLQAEVNNRLKSDALCVLLVQGPTVVDRLREVLIPIANAPELVDQFLSFVLARKELRKMTKYFLAELQKCELEVPSEAYGIVQGTLRSFQETEASKSVADRREADFEISQLLAQTSYHAEGWTALNALQDWRESSERTRVTKRSQAIRRMVERAMLVGKEYLLPSIQALVWLSESYGDLKSSRELSEAAFDLTYSLERLQTCVSNLGTGPVGPQVAEEIAVHWETIQQCSLSQSCDKLLAEPPRKTEPAIPVLERWLPEFYCLPFEITTVLASEMRYPPRIKSSWEEHGTHTHKVVVAAPFPLQPVHRIIQLLLTDMRKHGEIRSLEINFSLIRKDLVSDLIAEFRNLVRRQDTRGSGGSQLNADRIAREIGLPPIQFDAPAAAGSQYRVRLTFPNVLFTPLV